jgi:hypothetical protein
VFGRRRPRPTPADQTGSLGIGALVQVVDSGRDDAWIDEPIGLIVAPGGQQLAGYAGAGVPVAWTVAFDEPAYTKDGRGPYERATVPSRLLVAVEPDDPAAPGV